MNSPSFGIRDLLVAADIGQFAASTGWSIHIGAMPDRPDTAIGVYDTGGRPPNPKWLVDYPSVMVRVRGEQSGYVEARQKASDIGNALLGLPSQDLNGDRWDSVSMIGHINSLGRDENNRPQFSLNFALIIEPASGTHREPL